MTPHILLENYIHDIHKYMPDSEEKTKKLTLLKEVLEKEYEKSLCRSNDEHLIKFKRLVAEYITVKARGELHRKECEAIKDQEKHIKCNICTSYGDVLHAIEEQLEELEPPYQVKSPKVVKLVVGTTLDQIAFVSKTLINNDTGRKSYHLYSVLGKPIIINDSYWINSDLTESL